MDKGVKFAIDNCEKLLKLVTEHKEYKSLRRIVIREYYYLKAIKCTGNIYDYFEGFKSGKHKHAKSFEFVSNYGILSNENMADYLKEHFSSELNHYMTIDDLEIGEIYTNNEISSIFKCDGMRGIRYSKRLNVLVLIMNHKNLLYKDNWSVDGILHYTGTGKIGNQSIEKSENKRLAYSRENDIKVYLFESFKSNEYYYHGEVELISDFYYDKQYDENGNLRKVLKFPLRKKDGFSDIIYAENDIRSVENKSDLEASKLSYETLRERAQRVDSISLAKEVKIAYRQRDAEVSRYTKCRAKGHCDLCGKLAPFIDSHGEPFLETHHLIWLSKGGPDGIFNTVALCPNCHREVHSLDDLEVLKKLQDVILRYLIDDDDEINIKKFNKLFKKK